jgi:hypothetical protein
MSITSMLDRLEAVRRTGRDRWLARCPAHDDRRPSLSIRDLGDGRVLLHCFAECAVADVLKACGLGFDAILPSRAIDHQLPRERRPFNPWDILAAIRFEALVAYVAARDMAQGKRLSEPDRERLLVAATRIQTAAEVANG